MSKTMKTLAFAALLMTAPIAARADPLAPLPAAEVAPTSAETRLSETALAQMADRFGTTELAPGEFRWASDMPRSGETEVVVSLADQMAFVYRAGELVGVTTVSSGKTDHETPTGVFPILAKEKVHRSTKYDDAPMPYMQRLNEYGVALHGGNLPGYPASHGCVRLPMKFAAQLFTLTAPGTRVIIEG